MLECNRSNVLEGIDTNKTDGWHGCIIWHFPYFFKINSKFQSKKLIRKSIISSMMLQLLILEKKNLYNSLLVYD